MIEALIRRCPKIQYSKISSRDLLYNVMLLVHLTIDHCHSFVVIYINPTYSCLELIVLFWIQKNLFTFKLFQIFLCIFKCTVTFFKAMQFLLPFINFELNKNGLVFVLSAILSPLVFGQATFTNVQRATFCLQFITYPSLP